MRRLLLKSRLASVVLCAACAVAPATAWAQAAYGGRQAGYGQRGMTQSNFGAGQYGQQGGYGAGGFGGGGYGGGFSGGMTGGFGGGFGQSAFGGGTFGNAGFGQGGFGQGGFGQGGFGQGGMQGGAYGQQRGGYGQRNFVGRDAMEVGGNFQQQFGGGGQRPGGGFAAMIQNFNEMREARRRWREQQNAPPPVKVRLEPAFDLAPAATSIEVQNAVQERLTDTLATHGLGQAQVTATADAMVLTGVVASEHQRRLIALLVSLEPGVGPIDNRLVVGTPAVASAAPGTR